MQKLSIALACCACLASCDEGLSTTQPDLQMSMMPDLAPAGPPRDLAMRIPNGVVCGSSTCTSPQTCCEVLVAGALQSSCLSAGTPCADGGVTAMCDGPEDCSTGSCCVTVGFQAAAKDGGTPMSTGGAASCSDSCTPGLDLGNSMITTELCHTGADCAGVMGTTPLGSSPFDGCCTLPQAGNIQACAPKMYATLLKYTCQ